MRSTKIDNIAPMSDPLKRRDFLAAAGAIAATGLVNSELPAAEATDGKPASQLALHGGPKSVTTSPGKLVRWGEPERENLEAMLHQDSLFYWKGPQTQALIERFQKLCPNKYVMTCSSGTAALHIAACACHLKPGDEVITSPITDVGTVIGVIYQQAVPVFADLDAQTYNLDVDDVERKITAKTKAIIAVHLAGNPCDMQRLRKLADDRGLILIEDCAQSWGAQYRGQPIGTLGHIACFSLQQSKHITCGDGGIVASNDPRFGTWLQRFGDKGFDRLGKSGLFESFATNYRMSEPQAAVAAAQLDRAQAITVKRAELGNQLNAALQNLRGITPHGVHAEDRCTYWFTMFRLVKDQLKCDRAEFVKALAAEGVPASAGYIPVPVYGNPVFQQHAFFAGHWPIKQFGLTTMDYTQVHCREAEAILQSGVRLVIHEAMTAEYIASVAQAVRKVAEHYAAS